MGEGLAKGAYESADENEAQEGVVGGEDEVAERLHAEALLQSGREYRELAQRMALPEEHEFMLLPAPRGCVTAVCVSQDEEWVWCGDKNGNVWRALLKGRHREEDWQLVARHEGQALCLAVSDTSIAHTLGARVSGDRSTASLAQAKHTSLVASGGTDKSIFVYDGATAEHIKTLTGHRGPVTGLAFRLGTNTLFSGARDRTLKVWSAEEGICMDTFYGPTGAITGVAAAWKDQAVVTSDDSSCRMFKIEKGTCLAFDEQRLPMEACAMVDDGHFIACSADGTVSVFDGTKKRPVAQRHQAHGTNFRGDGDGLEQDFGRETLLAVAGGKPLPDQNNWCLAAAAVPYSDLAATGGWGGEIVLWRVEQREVPSAKGTFVPGAAKAVTLDQTAVIPVRGIVSALHFARSGSYLAAAVTREPRLGRWVTDRAAPNLILVAPLTYADVPRPEGNRPTASAARRTAAAAEPQRKAAALRPKKRKRLML
eukprot:TRINITY_DN56212_c0_g1_i1.p2 TRINITY_DN56212_c0_g1~~TRINITY_DN56212_c0_g1_i1.p2  ORF type:complete len:536 (+),score=169.43 TRINITY_DN56212_c0_g1_i1:164-1609(+)